MSALAAIRKSRFGRPPRTHHGEQADDEGVVADGTDLAAKPRRVNYPGSVRMTRPLPTLALLLLSACAAYTAPTDRNDLGDTAMSPGTGDATGGAQANSFRFDVFPDASSAAAEGAPASLLPHSFDEAIDAGPLDLVLEPPVHIEGLVTAYRVGPVERSVPLPGAEEAVLGTLSLQKSDTVQGRAITLADDGSYAVDLVPDTAYRLAVVPDDPALPTYTEETDLVEDQVLDLDLGAGSALWGRVVDGQGNPLSGVAIEAVNAFGPTTPTVSTDADGVFLLRVSPGSWHVIAMGRGNGRAPTLQSDLLYVGENGASATITYANLTTYTVGGRMQPGTGPGVRDGIARFTATSLQDYPDTASLVVEARADAFGNYDTRLLAGRYEVDLFPADDQDLTPVDLGEVRVTGPTDLGTTTLPVSADVEGLVVDPDDAPVAGALVECVEPAFGARSFSAHTDDNGLFAMSAPRIPLDCDIVPPGERTDLALTRRVLDPGSTTSPILELDPGQLVTGTVRYDDAGTLRPLQLGVIEVRDAKGQLLGTALTGVSDGTFAVRITPPVE